MVDYIKRDELLDALTEVKDENASSEAATYVLGRMIETVARIPAADVRPCGKGKWLKNKEYGFLRCSECGDIYPYADYVLAWHFCPNCGINMK